MKSSILLTSTFILIVLLPLIQCSVTTRNDSITKTCMHTPFYELCISTLRSKPQSSQANATVLSLILVHVAKAKAIIALNNINKLKVSSPQFIVPLSKCSKVYNTVLSYHIPRTLQALSEGDHKAAEVGMSKSVTGAEECKNILNTIKKPPQSIIRLGKILSDLFAIIMSIMKSLLGATMRRHGSI